VNKRRHWLLVATIAAAIVAMPLVADAGRALLNVIVPAQKWKSVRIKDLPLNASIALAVQTDGTLDIIFVHQDELAKFPAAVNPAFQGTVERTMSFRVVIPKPGNYFVILDNRKGSGELKVKVDIQAHAAPKNRDDIAPSSSEPKKQQRI
jgi:hypothetical protein